MLPHDLIYEKELEAIETRFVFSSAERLRRINDERREWPKRPSGIDRLHIVACEAWAGKTYRPLRPNRLKLVHVSYLANDCFDFFSAELLAFLRRLKRAAISQSEMVTALCAHAQQSLSEIFILRWTPGFQYFADDLKVDSDVKWNELRILAAENLADLHIKKIWIDSCSASEVKAPQAATVSDLLDEFKELHYPHLAHEKIAERMNVERSVYFDLKRGARVSNATYIKVSKFSGIPIDTLKRKL